MIQRHNGIVGLYLLFRQDITNRADGFHALAQVRINIHQRRDLAYDLGKVGLEQYHFSNTDLSLHSQRTGKGKTKDLKALKHYPADCTKKVVDQVQMEAAILDLL